MPHALTDCASGCRRACRAPRRAAAALCRRPPSLHSRRVACLRHNLLGQVWRPARRPAPAWRPARLRAAVRTHAAARPAVQPRGAPSVWAGIRRGIAAAVRTAGGARAGHSDGGSHPVAGSVGTPRRSQCHRRTRSSSQRRRTANRRPDRAGGPFQGRRACAAIDSVGGGSAPHRPARTRVRCTVRMRAAVRQGPDARVEAGYAGR
mmetsp:Transcript_23130/g.74907  ORF Transcript_23130/g.74907 Transcript_23130/m.74907 type:complete len:206 (-) Transcript_23130:2166-2783(-)